MADSIREVAVSIWAVAAFIWGVGDSVPAAVSTGLQHTESAVMHSPVLPGTDYTALPDILDTPLLGRDILDMLSLGMQDTVL